jgi:hypothetical protein
VAGAATGSYIAGGVNQSLVVGQVIVDGAMIRHNENQLREQGCTLGVALAAVSVLIMGLSHLLFVATQVGSG